MPEKFEGTTPPQESKEKSSYSKIPGEYADEIRQFVKRFEDPKIFNKQVDNWIEGAEQYGESPTREDAENSVKEAMEYIGTKEATDCEKFWERVVTIAQELDLPAPLSTEEIQRWSYLYYDGLKKLKEEHGENSEQFKSAMDDFQGLSKREALYRNYRVNTNVQSLSSRPAIFTDWPDKDIRSTLENGWNNHFQKMEFEDFWAKREKGE